MSGKTLPMILFVAPKGRSNLMRKADSFDREWLSDHVQRGTWSKVILNDEQLEDGGILLTVSNSAWKELEELA